MNDWLFYRKIPGSGPVHGDWSSRLVRGENEGESGGSRALKISVKEVHSSRRPTGPSCARIRCVRGADPLSSVSKEPLCIPDLLPNKR